MVLLRILKFYNLFSLICKIFRKYILRLFYKHFVFFFFLKKKGKKEKSCLPTADNGFEPAVDQNAKRSADVAVKKTASPSRGQAR